MAQADATANGAVGRDLPIKEAARVLNRTPRALWRACRQGAIGYRLTPHGPWYVTPEEIDRVRRGLPAKVGSAS